MEKFILFFGVITFIGMSLMSPTFLLPTRLAMKAIGVWLCALLFRERLSPPHSNARVLADLIIFVCLMRMLVIVPLRLLIADWRRTRNWLLPRWLDVMAAVWISAILTFAGFIALSWATAGWPRPWMLHLLLASAGAVMLVLTAVWRRRSPRFLRFLRHTCAGACVTLVAMTGYSWFYYPTLVLSEAEEVAGGSPFCIYFPTLHDVARTSGDLSFLTVAKSPSGAHFFVVTETQLTEWSFYQRRFVPESTEDTTAFASSPFKRWCSNPEALNTPDGR